MVSFLGATPIDMSTEKYVQTPHIAAGMFFCEGKCVDEVPYDPNLPNLFVGEEILHSARVWTAGYDIYSPTKISIYHLYTREDQPHVWDDKKTFDDTDALNKVKYILNLHDANFDPNSIPNNVKDNIEHYGLGTKRTIQEFFDFAGIDAQNKTIYKNFCPKPHAISPESGVPGEQSVEGFVGLNDSYRSLLSTYNIYILFCLFAFVLIIVLFIAIFNKRDFFSKIVSKFDKMKRMF
jgi:hypothetical protein